MSRTVVVGASSGLGRCIGIGLAQRGGQIALLARRRARIEAAAEEAGASAIASNVMSPTRFVPLGVRSSGRVDGRHRQPHLHAGHQPAGPDGRHRRRHLAAHLRHQRHRRIVGDGGGDSASDGLCRQGGVPLLRRRQLRAAVARPWRIRRQQSRAGKTRGSLAGRALRTSASRRSSSASAPAAKVTRQPG